MSESIRFDADSYCIVHLRPNSDVVQMMSNVVDEKCAAMYCRELERQGGHVFAAVPAGVLVGALQYIRPGARKPKGDAAEREGDRRREERE